MKPGRQLRIGSLVFVFLLVISGAGLALETADGSAVGKTNVSSTFDADDGGWLISGDAQGESAEPTFISEGGSPGGHICAKDDAAGGTWYFSAPSRFLGPMDNYYNGTLTFDLKQSSTSSQFDQTDIELQNGTHTIVYDFGDESTHPGENWTSYSIPLSATDDAWSFASGSAISATEFRRVLANLTALRIRGEYVSGSDRGCLDSVRLEADTETGEGSPPEMTIAMQDQVVQDSGTLVVVQSVTLKTGGFVSIRNSSSTGEILGVSNYLNRGNHSTVRIRLDSGSAVRNTQTLVAVAHNDSDADAIFDFAVSNGTDDGPFMKNGEPISDAATVSYVTPSPTTTASPTETDTLTPTATESPTSTSTPTPRNPTKTTTRPATERTTSADAPGFNMIVTMVGLLLASWLFARRGLERDDE